MRLVAISAALALSLLGTAVWAQPKPPQPPTEQRAQVAADAEVTVLYAFNGGKKSTESDKLKQKLPQLTQPPLSAYDTYEQVKTETLALDRDNAREMALPEDRTLKVKLEDVLAPKKGSAKPRYALKASIVKAGGKALLPELKVQAEADEVFFVAGPAYKKGILVIGIRLAAK